MSGLGKRAADIPMRLRLEAKGRWHRGHGLWVHDVLGFRGSPAAWKEALLWAASGTSRELTAEEAHKFRRLAQPVVVAFTAADGPDFEAVTTRQHLPLLLDPLLLGFLHLASALLCLRFLRRRSEPG